MGTAVANKNKLFSSAVGGFKKSQVVEYIEELNRKAKLMSEQSGFEISRLEAELHGFEEKNESMRDQIKNLESEIEKLKTVESENAMLKDDVENQRAVIESLKRENDELASKLFILEKDYNANKAKAEQFEADKKNAGGLLERAKAESARIIANANAESAEIAEKARNSAREAAEKITAESERLLAENIRKVKYLYRRRDELLSAFEKVKDAAGGFYEKIASTLSKDIDE